MGHKPSEYQENIYDQTIAPGTDTIAVNAVAGSGKTTTIVNCLELIPKNKKIIFLAFNVAIVEELKTKVPANVEVSTLHGFGMKTLKRWYGNKIKLSEGKVFFLGLKLFKKWNIEENQASYVYRVSKIVDYMRIYMEYEDNVKIAEIASRHSISIFKDEIKNAKELLAYSNKAMFDSIDFVDMIHLPASKNIKLQKYDYIFVDEAQDLSKAQQTMVKKMMNYNTKVIYVGDPMQAIYSFAGSDSNSFYNLGEVLGNKVKELPLSVCYRCGVDIVNEAKSIVPYIEHSSFAEQGIVRDGIREDISGDMIVVCRNTKPLVQLFFELLNKGVKANIKGKEIGDNIIRMIDKTRQTNIESMLKHLESDRLKLKSKLVSKGVSKPENHQSMADFMEKKEIIKILSQSAISTAQLKKQIKLIFVDEEQQGIVLMTIHKSKGLENKKIAFLNPELIPSKYAFTGEELQQEQNLKYVAITRAKSELIYIRHFGQ